MFDGMTQESVEEPLTEPIETHAQPGRGPADYVAIARDRINEGHPSSAAWAVLALAQQQRAATLLAYFTSDTSGMTLEEHNLLRDYLLLPRYEEKPQPRQTISLGQAQQATLSNLIAYATQRDQLAESDANFIASALGLNQGGQQ